MKKAMFKWLSTMLAISLLLAGCAKKETSPPPVIPAEPSKTGSISAKKLSGDFEIQYFVGGYGDAWWKEVIGDFQKANPDLKIRESAGPKINDQMKSRWISNTPPDVVYIDGAGIDERQMAKDGQLMDLTAWIKAAKALDGKKITDHLIAQPLTQADGKQYSIPLVFGYNATFYDAALFKQKGWEPPADFDSFMSIMKKAKDAGMQGYTHQGIYPSYIIGGLLNSGFAAEGGLQVLEDINALKKGVFLSNPVQKTMAKVQKMRDEGFIDSGALALNHTAAQMQHLQHKAAFIPSGLWLPHEMQKDVPKEFKYGLIPSVMQEKGKKFEIIPYVSTMAIASKARNPEAASAFMQFVFQKKYAQSWVQKTGALLNYKTDISHVQGVDDYAKQAASYLNDASKVNIDQTKNLGNPDMTKAIENATVAFLSGELDAKGWGERLEKDAQQYRGK
jgi:N-acetylglucosamine transport system substrate-binding protein